MALTATVTPGKTLIGAELATNSKLNQGFSPTVSLSGTADTADITNDAVTAAKAAFGAWFYGVDTGTATAHVVAIAGHALAAYVDGLHLRYRVNAGNLLITVHSLSAGALTSSSNTADCTTPSAHALKVGDTVMVYGATQEEYNGTFRVDSLPSTTRFTYKFAGSSTTPATGTISVRYADVGGTGSFIQTAGVTVNIAGLGAKNLFGPGGTRLMPGDILNGEEIEIVYNGTSDWFEILSRETASEVIRAVDDSTSVNAYTAQPLNGRTASPANNTVLVCRMALANTAAATLAFGSLSAAPILKNGTTALTGGEIIAGQWCQFVWDGASWQLLSPVTPDSSRATVPVRQTVLGCSVDATTGLPNFLKVGTVTTTVETQNCATTPLVVSFAYGFDDIGAVDYVARISTDAANWTGLGGTTTYYLYVDRHVGTGAITYGITTSRPTYVNHSTVAAGAGFHTYLINTGFMYEGSATTTAVQRVFVGEATTSAGVVTAVIAYVPRGEYVSAETAFPQSTAVNDVVIFTHQLGLKPAAVRLVLRNTTTQYNYTEGDDVELFSLLGGSFIGYGFVVPVTSVTALVAVLPWGTIGSVIQVMNKTSYAVAQTITTSKWRLVAYARRGW